MSFPYFHLSVPLPVFGALRSLEPLPLGGAPSIFGTQGADSVKLLRGEKIPIKAAALSLHVGSFCFLNKLAQ